MVSYLWLTSAAAQCAHDDAERFKGEKGWQICLDANGAIGDEGKS